MPEIHGADKGINPYVQPEKQTIKPMTINPEVRTYSWRKPRIGQGRAGLRRKVKSVTLPMPNKTAQVTSKSDLQNSEITTQPQTSSRPKPQIENILEVQTTPGQQSRPKLLTK